MTKTWTIVINLFNLVFSNFVSNVGTWRVDVPVDQRDRHHNFFGYVRGHNERQRDFGY